MSKVSPSFIIQNSRQPALHHLLPGYGCGGAGGVGLCLGEVSELHWQLWEGSAQTCSVLHQADLAAQQVPCWSNHHVKETQTHKMTTKLMPFLSHRLLEYSLNPDKIRLTDVASVVNDVAENPAGQALAWNFIRAHWDYVSQGWAADYHSFSCSLTF